MPSVILTYPCDDSRMVDGWMQGKHSELLFWVPPDYRSRLGRPRNTEIIGHNATLLDFSRLLMEGSGSSVMLLNHYDCFFHG